ncbi:radiation-inducible immediate-early gene IEX-1 [Clinocottus analis]|uniref:radiation-inducible immediate-early gene IEX-1 n=1 Tax=Clinocottus analis TaxID=304258 RepID=UPI0035BF76EF
MYSRSDSVTLTLQRESFGFPRSATRSTEPEVFTFERVPPQASAVLSYAPIRPKRRCARVMYPAKVRMHLPPPEKRSPAARWLLALCLVVLWQIYTEEPCADAPGADGPVTDYQADYQSFPFRQQCAEEPQQQPPQQQQQQQQQDLGSGPELLSATPALPPRSF